MNSIHIRQATIEDSAQLVPLMEQLGYTLSFKEIKERIHIYMTKHDYMLFVSLEEERVTGTLALNFHEMFVLPSRKAKIEALVVDENHRRKGIAQALMRKAESYAKEYGCTVIELTSGMRRASMGSHDFYKKLGYQNEGPLAKLYLRKEL